MEQFSWHQHRVVEIAKELDNNDTEKLGLKEKLVSNLFGTTL